MISGRARASEAVGTLSVKEDDLVFLDLTEANQNVCSGMFDNLGVF
jgi:hypothetical protein